DAFFPCRAVEEPYKGVCAFYAPRYFIKQKPGAYAEALAWCTTVGKGPDEACAKGVGSVAMKQHITDPAFAEQVCMAGTAFQQPYCIEGLVSYYIVHFASTSKGEQLCSMLKEAHRDRC